MIEMEMRAWIKVPGLPLSDEARWEPFIEALERDHDELGPILSWDKETGAAEIIVLVDTDDQAAAALTAVDAVTAALHKVGLGQHYPASIEVAPVPADELAQTPA
jgi:hypothetical protein